MYVIASLQVSIDCLSQFFLTDFQVSLCSRTMTLTAKIHIFALILVQQWYEEPNFGHRCTEAPSINEVKRPACDSVAEPEPVGAEIFRLEPEPRFFGWSRSRFFWIYLGSFLASEKQDDLKVFIFHCTVYSLYGTYFCMIYSTGTVPTCWLYLQLSTVE